MGGLWEFGVQAEPLPHGYPLLNVEGEDPLPDTLDIYSGYGGASVIWMAGDNFSSTPGFQTMTLETADGLSAPSTVKLNLVDPVSQDLVDGVSDGISHFVRLRNNLLNDYYAGLANHPLPHLIYYDAYRVDTNMPSGSAIVYVREPDVTISYLENNVTGFPPGGSPEAVTNENGSLGVQLFLGPSNASKASLTGIGSWPAEDTTVNRAITSQKSGDYDVHKAGGPSIADGWVNEMNRLIYPEVR